MLTITIPASIEDAVGQLEGVERLLTAKQWERAAILAAFVEPDSGHGGREQTAGSSHLVSCRAFAALGITGLKSKDTVSEYVRRWLEDSGRRRPRPGDHIDPVGLPEWKKPDPGTRYEPGNGGAVHRIVDQPATVQQALSDPEFARKIISNPAVRKAAAEALVSTDEGLDAVFQANAEQPAAVEDVRRAARSSKAREAAETEETYHLRGFKALPVLWGAENLAEYIETRVARDPEDLAYARNAGLWLQAIGRRIVAWADGETLPLSDEDFASEIEALLGESR